MPRNMVHGRRGQRPQGRLQRARHQPHRHRQPGAGHRPGRAATSPCSTPSSARPFGKKIIEHQSIGNYLADMATRVDAARLLVYRAAWMKEQGMVHTKESSMAKLFAGDTAMFVADRAVQIAGGYGYTTRLPGRALLPRRQDHADLRGHPGDAAPGDRPRADGHRQGRGQQRRVSIGMDPHEERLQPDCHADCSNRPRNEGSAYRRRHPCRSANRPALNPGTAKLLHEMCGKPMVEWVLGRGAAA